MKKTNAWGVTSLVLAIISLFLWLAPYIGLPLAIMAVVFYVKQKKIKPTGIAIAGLVIGIVGIVLNGAVILFMLGGLAFAAIVPKLHGLYDSDVMVQPTEDVNKTIGEFNQTENKTQQETEQKIKSATLSIDKIQIQLANLYPTRVSVTNTGDVSIDPKFDIYVYDENNNEVCSGSPMLDLFNELDAGEKKTEEISIMGCMFVEDGTYILRIDLLDEDFNVLDSKTKDFEIDYWEQFEF